MAAFPFSCLTPCKGSEYRTSLPCGWPEAELKLSTVRSQWTLQFPEPPGCCLSLYLCRVSLPALDGTNSGLDTAEEEVWTWRWRWSKKQNKLKKTKNYPKCRTEREKNFLKWTKYQWLVRQIRQSNKYTIGIPKKGEDVEGENTWRNNFFQILQKL